MSRVRPITSMRFFAAMMVVAHHYWGFEGGYVGVGFFFVLSGYVLALNYSGRVDSWPERRDFWFKRFARIYPTHLLTFLLTLPLGASLVAVPANLALLQSWLPFGSLYMSVNKPSWSISVEAFFYALFPLLVGIRGRTLLPWGAGLALIACLWPANGLTFTVRGIETDPTHFLFYVFPPTRLFEFALGVWLARHDGRCNWKDEALAITFAAASMAVALTLPPSLGLAVAFIPASCLLVYVFSRSEGPVAKMLSARWLVLLGDASFAVYMLHWPLMLYIGNSPWAGLLAVSLSVAIYLWFEKPAQKWLLALQSFRRSARDLLQHERGQGSY